MSRDLLNLFIGFYKIKIQGFPTLRSEKAKLLCSLRVLTNGSLTKIVKIYGGFDGGNGSSSLESAEYQQ